MDTSSINGLSGHVSVPSAPAAPHPAGADQSALIQAVKAVNAAELFGPDQELSFIVDRATRRTVVRLVDRNTREVIRQIPAASVLQMASQSNQE